MDISEGSAERRLSTSTRWVVDHPLMVTFVLAVTMVVALCLVFEPRWQTNDDVAMSMIAHGYGSFLQGSPGLWFSGVIWGWLVRLIPEINGIVGYSLATMAVLAASAWVFMFVLVRSGSGYLVAILASALIIIRPVLFPQFTINAGLLSLAGVALLIAYARKEHTGLLVGACLLVFLGWIVRYHEALLVAAIAAPLVPWRAMLDRKKAWVALGLLLSAIALSTVTDLRSYPGPDWQRFRAFDDARRPITDYGIVPHLLDRPEILRRHDFSVNDIKLFQGWFFADPAISDPATLTAIAKDLGPPFAQPGAAERGLSALSSLGFFRILPLLAAALLLSILFPKWRLVIAWSIAVSLIFLVGVSGRPGHLITRVYVPVLSAFILLPLLSALNSGSVSAVGRRAAAVILLSALVWNLAILMPDQAGSRKLSAQLKVDLEGMPRGVLSTRASDFPVENVYGVLSPEASLRRFKLYSIGIFMYAPRSVSLAEERAGRSFIKRFVQGGGIPLVSSPWYPWQSDFGQLATYCRERHGLKLRVKVTYDTPSVLVREVECVAGGRSRG